MKQDRGDLIRLRITALEPSGRIKKVAFDAALINSTGEFYFDRSVYDGEIQMVEMEIEYPDGSKKLVVHGPKWAEITCKIIVDESKMDEEQIKLLGKSPNWQENFAMIRVLVDGTSHSICLIAGHSGDSQTNIFSRIV